MQRFLTAGLLMAGCFSVHAAEWQTCYKTAYDLSASTHKPILVYFTDSSQDASWKSRFEGMDEMVNEFVPVVADKATEQGARLFKLFELPGSTGTVVIESNRQWQYFRTAEQLESPELSKVLRETRGAEGKPTRSSVQLVSHTESTPTATSTPTTQSSNSYYYQPSGSCPNCRRYR